MCLDFQKRNFQENKTIKGFIQAGRASVSRAWIPLLFLISEWNLRGTAEVWELQTES